MLADTLLLNYLTDSTRISLFLYLSILYQVSIMLFFHQQISSDFYYISFILRASFNPPLSLICVLRLMPL